jgi:predicted KAP-like P-loop ATPase
LTSYTKILTDDAEVQPVSDFEKYADAIAHLVRGSKPKFSIGIYGEWGTGKTTLMKIIENKIKNDHDLNILTVWFNAWRYEREDHFALIALMKTIAYAMGDLPHYKEVKKVLFRGLGIIGKDLLRNLALKYAMTEKGLDELEKNILPKMELLSRVDKDTIYFDGLKKIEEEMEKITNTYNRRVVVFIDDLDRCSPKTALEVFESIKVFLGMEGFIYIVGLSHETISKLISVAYKDSEIKGEHYIRKIIQIPITIPEWDDPDVIKDLISNLAKKLDDKYSKIIEENRSLIATAVEFNPREIKRFINNFIISHEIYANAKVNSKELLVVQALKVRWNKFYSYISSSDKFRTELRRYIEMPEEERAKALVTRKNDNSKPFKEYERKLFTFESDYELWNFLDIHKNLIFQIKDWKIYQRAVESTKETLTDSQSPSKKDSEQIFKENLDQYSSFAQDEGLALIATANHLYSLSRYNEAIRYYEKLLAIRPDSAEAAAGKAQALLKIKELNS